MNRTQSTFQFCSRVVQCHGHEHCTEHSIGDPIGSTQPPQFYFEQGKVGYACQGVGQEEVKEGEEEEKEEKASGCHWCGREPSVVLLLWVGDVTGVRLPHCPSYR